MYQKQWEPSKYQMIARGGGRVERAQVGDPLELHFTILDLEVLFLQLLLSLFSFAVPVRDICQRAHR